MNAVIALSNYSTSHTRFRDLLTRICKTRYVSMPLFDAAMLEGAMNVNWRAIDRRTRSIARIVNKAEAVEIKTPNGTSISFSKKGRKGRIRHRDSHSAGFIRKSAGRRGISGAGGRHGKRKACD